MSDTTRTTGPVPGAIAGLVATAAALAAAEAVSALISRPRASPVLAVGDTVGDLTPLPLKQFAVDTFGTADKVALFVGMGAVLVVEAAVLGAISGRRSWIGHAGIAVFASVGLAVALTRPDSGALDVVPTLAGAVVCAAVLLWLLRISAPGPTEPAGADSPPPGFDRRRFALVAGAVAAASAGVGITARSFSGSGAELPRSDIILPRPAFPAAPIPDGADLEIDGLAPFLTPNEDFYRIDTALSVPRLDAAAWSLRIHGLGARERVYTFADLLARDDLTERDITLACVSNPVGGDYVGNARWIGVPLAALLEEAGVRSPRDGGRADQLVSRSEDGMTIGTPVADLMDGRDALLAVGMNGRPLPHEHGFPARMVVPGLYGYVSACKWIVDIELTTFDAFDAYWVPRGWSARGPVKTQSRIDTPRGSRTVGAGRVTVAGTAWAQHTGIDQVEIRVDEGDWQPVTLAAEDTADTWRQWVFDWMAEPGDHELTVRATDRRSRTQTADAAPPAPDGATGHHTVGVTVE